MSSHPPFRLVGRSHCSSFTHVRRHTPVSSWRFTGWGLPASLAFREPHLEGFPVLSRSSSTLQMLSQNVRGLHHRLAADHRWVPTHRLEVFHKVVFLLIRPPATPPRHPSLLLLQLHLQVLLQRLLQPLSLLLQHYLWMSPRHPPPPLSLPLTMTAPPLPSNAVLEPPRPPWLISPPRNTPPQKRSSLHSESPLKMIFKRPTSRFAPHSPPSSPRITSSPQQVLCTFSTQTPAMPPQTSPLAHSEEISYYQLPPEAFQAIGKELANGISLALAGALGIPVSPAIFSQAINTDRHWQIPRQDKDLLHVKHVAATLSIPPLHWQALS